MLKKRFLFFVFLFCQELIVAQTGMVVLNIRGIQAGKGGTLSAAVFTKDNFPKIGRETLGLAKPVIEEQMQTVFKDVPVGVYAVAVIQDVDSNKRLNTNWLGFPIEPFGFSRDARIRFGPPAFEAARVQVQAGETLTLDIVLR